jgi:two-component system nitrogen regulation response regulator GlnG
MVKEKKFREDLFFRLNIIPVRLPPLRERKEDIPLLCEFFLQRLAEEAKMPVKSVSSAGMDLLKEYSWPGNIRELENVLKRAAILSVNMALQVSDFSFFIGKKQEDFEQQMEELGLEELVARRLQSFISQLADCGEDNLYEKIIQMAERPLIRLLLEKTRYNQIQTAKLLGINRNTLRNKIRQLKIPPKGSA